MARCPYLDWEDKGFFNGGQYSCKACYKDLNETEAENKCKSEYYKDCPIYKSK